MVEDRMKSGFPEVEAAGLPLFTGSQLQPDTFSDKSASYRWNWWEVAFSTNITAWLRSCNEQDTMHSSAKSSKNIYFTNCWYLYLTLVECKVKCVWSRWWFWGMRESRWTPRKDGHHTPLETMSNNWLFETWDWNLWNFVQHYFYFNWGCHSSLTRQQEWLRLFTRLGL